MRPRWYACQRPPSRFRRLIERYIERERRFFTWRELEALARHWAARQGYDYGLLSTHALRHMGGPPFTPLGLPYQMHPDNWWACKWGNEHYGTVAPLSVLDEQLQPIWVQWCWVCGGPTSADPKNAGELADPCSPRCQAIAAWWMEHSRYRVPGWLVGAPSEWRALWILTEYVKWLATPRRQRGTSATRRGSARRSSRPSRASTAARSAAPRARP